MAELDSADAALLEVIQDPLPIVLQPFASLAASCGLGIDETLQRLSRLEEEGLLRRPSALLNGRLLGYDSVLVAARVPPALIAQAAERISAHPGVSHNYLRNHAYNLWFTLAAPASRDLSREAATLLEAGGAEDHLLLPAERTFKLRVRFSLGGGFGGGPENSPAPLPNGRQRPPAPAASCGPGAPSPAGLDETDRSALRQLQRPFPLVRRPFQEIAGQAGMGEEELMSRTAALQQAGIIRRISGQLRHRRSGYRANALACFRVPAGRAEEAGELAAAHPAVSHCIRRTVPPRWPYPLFAMIHGRREEECREAAVRIARETGTEDYQLLFSTREFKKERIYYRLEEL